MCVCVSTSKTPISETRTRGTSVCHLQLSTIVTMVENSLTRERHTARVTRLGEPWVYTSKGYSVFVSPVGKQTFGSDNGPAKRRGRGWTSEVYTSLKKIYVEMYRLQLKRTETSLLHRIVTTRARGLSDPRQTPRRQTVSDTGVLGTGYRDEVLEDTSYLYCTGRSIPTLLLLHSIIPLFVNRTPDHTLFIIIISICVRIKHPLRFS